MIIKTLLISMRNKPENPVLDSQLMDALEVKNSEELDLSKEGFSYRKFGAILQGQDITNLFRVLQKCPFITSLKLVNVMAPYKPTLKGDLIWFVDKALKDNTTLRSLSLADNYLSTAGSLLIGSIKSNDSLTFLDLSDNDIWAVEMTQIAQAIIQNKTLEIVYLKGNRITGDTISTLGHGLVNHPTLREVQIQDSCMDESAVWAISLVCRTETLLVIPKLTRYSQELTPSALALAQEIQGSSLLALPIANLIASYVTLDSPLPPPVLPGAFQRSISVVTNAAAQTIVQAADKCNLM